GYGPRLDLTEGQSTGLNRTRDRRRLRTASDGREFRPGPRITQSVIRICRADHGRGNFAADRVERVVVADAVRRNVRRLQSDEVLRVDLILVRQAHAARVRGQLVIGRTAACKVGVRGLRAVLQPVAVVRVAVEAQERRRSEVLRVLQLDDLFVVPNV